MQSWVPGAHGAVLFVAVLFAAVLFAGVVLFPDAVLLADVLLALFAEVLFDASSSGPQPTSPTTNSSKGAVYRSVFKSPLHDEGKRGAAQPDPIRSLERISESTSEDNSLWSMPQNASANARDGPGNHSVTLKTNVAMLLIEGATSPHLFSYSKINSWARGAYSSDREATVHVDANTPRPAPGGV